MNFTKIFIALFLFSNGIVSYSQGFELGKVSLEELQEKKHPKDTSAVAAVLFETGKVDFEFSQDQGFMMITEVKTRIKIYKKEGYDWANKKIDYYIGSSPKELVTFSDAVTYNLVNGKIEKAKLKSEGVFDENVNKYWSSKKIAMPNVKEGSIIEYKYRVKSKRYGELTDWAFQTKIPVNYSEYQTFVPEYFVYNVNMTGSITPIRTIEKFSKSLQFSYRENTMGERGGSVVSPTTSEKLTFMQTHTVYTAKNIPALKDETFVNNIDNYTSSISHELSSVHFPNQPYQNLSTNWESVAKAIYEDVDFGVELNKTGYFEDEIKSITFGLNTLEEKIRAIFNFVQNKMVWDGYNGYSCNDGVKTAFKNKKGNVAEINLMLTAMLRDAGLTANPVLVSTRSNGIAIWPSRTAFNYVIAAVENGSDIILLDATDKFSVPNVLPFRDLNWSGRLIRKDGSSTEVDLMPKLASNDVVGMSYSVNNLGEVSGKVRRQRTDHNAMIFRAEVKDVNEDAYLEKLENENNKIEVNEYSRTNEKDLKSPVIELISFTGSNFSEVIGDKIYLKPMLFFTQDQNPFKQETREYPVDFGFPFLDKYAINIQVPSGYKVETFPASSSISMQDGIASFKFMTSLSGDTIQFSVVSQINAPIIPAEYYTILKEYFQKIIEKQNEKIVLSKI